MVMDFTIQDKFVCVETSLNCLDALLDTNAPYFTPKDIVLSEDMQTAQRGLIVLKLVGAIFAAGSGALLYASSFTCAAFCATLCSFIFAATFRIDMSFYPYSERRAVYYAQGKKMSLEAYIREHGFVRFKQYGPTFKGGSPLVTQEEFSERFFKEAPTFREPKKRLFLMECLKNGFFTKQDMAKIESLFLRECANFYEMCNFGLFELLELGIFKESAALQEQLFMKGAWDEAELLFEHAHLIEKHHLVPKEIEGVRAFIKEHAANYALFKRDSIVQLEKICLKKKEALIQIEKEKEALGQKLSTGFFKAHPSAIQALDTEGFLEKGFDSACFYEVINAHIEKKKLEVEKTFENAISDLQNNWDHHMQELNQICTSYKRLALPALYFYRISLESFIDMYGFEVLKELVKSSDFPINQVEISKRFFLSRPDRASFFKDALIFDLWERGFLSVQVRLFLEQKILVTQNFLSIAHEGFIWHLLEKGLISSATKGRLRKLLDQALESSSASHLIAHWPKVRRYNLATNPENASLYLWLDQHVQAYGGMDADFNAYKTSLGYHRNDRVGYDAKKSPFGRIVLEDQRNWPILG